MSSYTVCPDTFYVNFVLFQNDSFYQEFNWRENPNNIRVTPANENSFELLDTTGLSAVMQIRAQNAPTGDPVLELVSGATILFPGKVSPNVVLTVPDISSLGPGNYIYDMLVTDGTGKTFTLFAGDITILENVTQVGA